MSSSLNHHQETVHPDVVRKNSLKEQLLEDRSVEERAADIKNQLSAIALTLEDQGLFADANDAYVAVEDLDGMERTARAVVPSM